MKLFHLTSPNIKGYIAVIYGTNGLLTRMDFANAELTQQQIHNYKSRIAHHVEHIYNVFVNTGVNVAEKEFEVCFEDFMREYPRKRNTHLAKAIWPKLTSGEQYKAFVGAMEYRKYAAKTKTPTFDYKPMLPDKWLSQKQYLNDWNKD